MKIRTLSLAVAIGCSGSLLGSFAASAATPPSDDAAKLKSQIEKMSQMQQSYEAELAKMKQLREQYQKKLDDLDKSKEQSQAVVDQTSRQANNRQYETLKHALDRIDIYGFFRAKYDDDDRSGIGSGSNNKHFYMDLEAKMRVNKDWYAHFQSETRKGYTVNQSWRKGDAGSSDQDGTVQRIWVEGTPYNINIALGTKWWGLGFQNVPFGHAADGVSVDYDVVQNWNVKGFWLRPRQGDLISMPNGSKTNIRGINVTTTWTDYFKSSVTYANNGNHDNEQKMNNLAALDLQFQVTKDILLRSAMVRTNADEDNISQEYRIDYKGYDLKDVGSWGLYTRYFDFERYGDYSHDDEWGSLPGDTKGWIWGATFVPFKNVVWETFFSIQRRNRSADATIDHDALRHLFRTQIDYHF
ncbi:hypothetical protein [Celerinatantimonas diazotrophica]|uniref:Porin n=1 Tax=Celerinatantimonas diazotrophica TaxID=412034 RepID=A0A4R1K1E5_9GAMM|nr:hypothetical protein [Celerinatantimonas diazotrophica]TCK57710.1 hypothetical protein EV690_1404 [Celerinatantimonas diazotrophica]CAG9298228.1 hypothetical protein CEDIAZO_03423 [Celerinatantimonas diazotrophica]